MAIVRFGSCIVVGAMALFGTPAVAADLGGDCCADLEERIAELEATAARKGNRKVSLTVQGQVHKAVLFWDDGIDSDAYVVGNKNDQSNFALSGSAEFVPGWTAGYELVVRLKDNLSDGVNQGDDNGEQGFFVWQSNWFVESATFGKVTMGLASRVTDTAPETDLSETGVAAYAGVQDVAGGFSLRRTDGGFVGFGWGDLYNHMNGDTANVVRYDTPEFAGFVASASWGEDDIWDVGLRYAGEGGAFTYEGVIAYSEVTDTDGQFADIAHKTLVGSASILHSPSGLNLTLAAGQREFDGTAADLDGVNRTPEDNRFVYAKLGWLAKLTGLGPTAFYGEYGWFSDYLTAGQDAGVMDTLSIAGVSGCGVGGVCRVAGSEARVWGLGVVQHIEAAEMQIYLGYRRNEAEFDILDGAGNAVEGAPLEDFDTLVAGSKIAF